MKRHLVCIALGFAVSVTGWAQQFVVKPANPILFGEPVAISVRGLPKGQDVKIISERAIVDETGNGKTILYRAEAVFSVGPDGIVDLALAVPKSGTYKGADARGLFWSMQPVADGEVTDRKQMVVRLEVRISTDTKRDDKPIASTLIEFVDALPGVKTEVVGKLPGALFATLAAAGEISIKRPAVILLGGSEGGNYVARGAASLASYGFAVLALPYYSPADGPTGKAEFPTLPRSFADIPIDRLEEARAWLQTRDDVDASRIAVRGVSKGAEFALLAGVYMPWITAIVAVVPSDVVWEGWGEGIEPGKRSSFSYRRQTLPFVPYADFGREFVGYQTGEPVRIRRPQDKGRAANPAAAVAARIPVEKIKAPVMVVAGQDDQLWNSAMMAHNIAERRAEAKLDTVSLIYTDAGHLLSGTGYDPTTQYDVGLSMVGGTPAGNARAQADAWPKTIQFLKRTLGMK